MAATAGVILYSLFLLLFFSLDGVRFVHAKNGLAGEREKNNNSNITEMVPLMKVEMGMMLNDSRRKLGSFQICALCTCCGGASKNYCLPSPCCYAINCNIPNRPFGFCSFTPKTCNCFGCHL